MLEPTKAILRRGRSAPGRIVAEEEMKKVMADYPGILFINPGMPLGDTHDRTVDGVHPTDAGFDFITQRLCAILNEEF